MIYDLTKKIAYKIQFGLTWLEHISSARNLLMYRISLNIAASIKYFPSLNSFLTLFLNASHRMGKLKTEKLIPNTTKRNNVYCV